MRILISNDDGIHATGIHALAKEFSGHDVFVVAPEREKSTTGHFLTLHKPLRLKKVAPRAYWVSGGPADCIYLGIAEVLRGKRPDLVLSGINRGANLGQDVFYSGTASAAREAANIGLPSMAISLDLSYGGQDKHEHYASAAKAARRALQMALKSFCGGKKLDEKKALRHWPERMMLNVNVPNLPWGKIKGFKPATQGQRIYGSQIVKRQDARGRDYFWIGGTYEGYRKIPDTDCWWVDHGYVAVTPLELDTTMAPVYEQLKGDWK
jgi:5'-nucleotidase